MEHITWSEGFSQINHKKIRNFLNQAIGPDSKWSLWPLINYVHTALRSANAESRNFRKVARIRLCISEAKCGQGEGVKNPKMLRSSFMIGPLMRLQGSNWMVSRDPDSGQQSLLFEIDYPEIAEGIVPRHRFMSAYEQKIEPPGLATHFQISNGSAFIWTILGR